MNDQCNVGKCNLGTHKCYADPNQDGTSCDDGGYCTVNDVCSGGLCSGASKDCSDNVGCTDDSCDEINDQCVNAVNNGNCGDLNACTNDVCDVALDCQYINNNNQCDDGNYCTVNDACLAGACGGPARDCSVNNLAPIANCINVPDSNPFTFDFRPSFTSTCDEANDQCKSGNATITSVCDQSTCNAPCDEDTNCSDTDCNQLDDCYDNIKRVYGGIENSCVGDCSCTSNGCDVNSGYTEEADVDKDGYSSSCGDCDDNNGDANPEGLDNNCNGIDEDCDDEEDDDYASLPTDCGIGACSATGATSCVNAQVADSCTPGQPSADDATCNGIDDDCDGQADEDYQSQGTVCGVGACLAQGATSCVNGRVVDSCTAGTPSPDNNCDGIDDDCDGTKDQNYASLPTDCGIGACGANGATSCVAGQVADSCTPGHPSADDATCNGIDDDCDGTKDQDYIETQTLCGIGACGANGLLQCVTGLEVDSCTKGIPSEEVCEGQIDDDCNGVVDNGCACTIGDTQPCGSDEGECQKGIQTCEDGEWGLECAGEILPVPEICDNLDNDCDITIDEGITQDCGTGLCAGTQTCSAGNFGDCSTSNTDVGVCAICSSDGTPSYDQAQDDDCACPGDECTDENGDGIIDAYKDYTADSQCQNIYVCSSCGPTITEPDDKCKTVMKIPIDKGVSLFSLPLIPDAPVAFDDVQSGCTLTTADGIAYYDPTQINPATGDNYFYIDDNAVLFPGQGYFTTQTDACDFTISGFKFTIERVGLLGTNDIFSEWDIIGAPSDQVDDFDDVEGNCNVVSGPHGFDAVAYGYRRTQTLVPGKGYFIKTTNDCKLS